jgi:hypothetical protein
MFEEIMKILYADKDAFYEPQLFHKTKRNKEGQQKLISAILGMAGMRVF